MENCSLYLLSLTMSDIQPFLQDQSVEKIQNRFVKGYYFFTPLSIIKKKNYTSGLRELLFSVQKDTEGC